VAAKWRQKSALWRQVTKNPLSRASFNVVFSASGRTAADAYLDAIELHELFQVQQ
jgi:hypothetical protein